MDCFIISSSMQRLILNGTWKRDNGPGTKLTFLILLSQVPNKIAVQNDIWIMNISCLHIKSNNRSHNFTNKMIIIHGINLIFGVSHIFNLWKRSPVNLIRISVLNMVSVIILTNNRKWLAHTVHRLRSTDSSCTSKHPGLSNVRDWYIVFIAWAWWTGDFNTVYIKLVCHKHSLSANCCGIFCCTGQDHRYASSSCIVRVQCQCRLCGWAAFNSNFFLWCRSSISVTINSSFTPVISVVDRFQCANGVCQFVSSTCNRHPGCETTSIFGKPHVCSSIEPRCFAGQYKVITTHKWSWVCRERWGLCNSCWWIWINKELHWCTWVAIAASFLYLAGIVSLNLWLKCFVFFARNKRIIIRTKPLRRDVLIVVEGTLFSFYEGFFQEQNPYLILRRY